MTKQEHAAALRNDPNVHYNCAQSVIIPFAEEIGLSPEQLNALALNFGGGMGCGSVCGAITGALLTMGGLNLPQEKRLDLFRHFREKYGAIQCSELVKSAMDQGIDRKEHCDCMVGDCVAFVCSQINKE